MPIILVFRATVVYDLVYFLGRALLVFAALSIPMVWTILLEAVYNGSGLLLYRPLSRLFLQGKPIGECTL